MTANGWATIVIIAGLALIGFLFGTAPDTARDQMPLLLTALGGFIVLLLKQGDSDKKIEENTAVTTAAKSAATQSVVASKDNAHAIEIVTSKQDTTNSLVDGHLSTLTAKLDAMAAKIASLEHDKATKAAETEKIINAMTGAAPTGSTPAHGTPIGGGTPAEGATVITIDPPEAATITSVPPKGKRPKVGDQQ